MNEPANIFHLAAYAKRQLDMTLERGKFSYSINMKFPELPEPFHPYLVIKVKDEWAQTIAESNPLDTPDDVDEFTAELVENVANQQGSK